ncbi:MAG TPA: hypothetical protein VNO86_10130 [Candidatus Binatia bacterium]|nr:hypothetical protein [Candidatus Binatia bacterium]
MNSSPTATDLGELWAAVLDLLASVVMPDWASVVSGLLPAGLALLVLLGVALLARVWFRAWRQDPARRARRRRRPSPTAGRAAGPVAAVGRWLVLVPLGGAVAAAGLLDRSLHPSGNLALLLVGLLLALLGVGLAVRTSEVFLEEAGSGAAAPGSAVGVVAARLAAIRASLKRLPRPLRRLPVLVVAAVGVVLGLLLVPSPTGPADRAVANLPLLLAGLAVGLATVAGAVRDWERLDREG